MRDPENVTIDFDGVRVRGPAHRVSEGVYRLAWTPWGAVFADIEINIGDTVETAPTEDGHRRFTRVVERSVETHQGWAVGPAFLRSSYFDAFAAALQACGGTWEVPINGWLITHVPPGSPVDIPAELGRQLDQARVAGVVDTEVASAASASYGHGHRCAPDDGRSQLIPRELFLGDPGIPVLDEDRSNGKTSESVGVAMAEAEVRIQPPQVFFLQLLVILAQWAFGVWLLPVLRTPTSPTPLGWALFVPCLLVFIASKVWMFRFFGKHRASPMFKAHAAHLITEFPFSAARNPFYLFDLLLFLGLSLLFGALDPLLLHGPLFFLFLALYVVPREEQRLLLAHGVDYEAYQSRVRRWGLF